MPTPALDQEALQQAMDASAAHETKQEAAAALGLPASTYTHRLRLAEAARLSPRSKGMALVQQTYDEPAEELTPQQAWDAHRGVFQNKLAEVARRQKYVIKRPRGPYVITHLTDMHLDDDGAPLDILQADIEAAKGMDAIMACGGDVLNNWPLMGKLAAQWSKQECTMHAALLRARHFIDLVQPDVWVLGNHDAWNGYLGDLFAQWLPEGCFNEEWTCFFRVESQGGRTLRAGLSHKFQKGSSHFHANHGEIREALQGQEADLLMDGHYHQDGVLQHTLPEREKDTCLVASAGYKALDDYATRISRGNGVPKLRGRCHFIVIDPFANYDEDFCMPFKSARHAEIHLNGLQNLRAI